jgi:hypothetical protein
MAVMVPIWVPSLFKISKVIVANVFLTVSAIAWPLMGSVLKPMFTWVLAKVPFTCWPFTWEWRGPERQLSTAAVLGVVFFKIGGFSEMVAKVLHCTGRREWRSCSLAKVVAVVGRSNDDSL